VAADTLEHVRVAVVGSGFGGIGASVALQRAGIEHVVLERADDVGGTWRDNSYPGCRCDVPSHLYSFSFAPHPDWSETYAPQPEIQAYLRHVAERFGVVGRTRFGHEVLDATWHDGEQRWHLHTPRGLLTADVVVLANGPLAEPRLPDLPGIDTFTGPAFHTARWRHDVDLTGLRVAVVGTGASAIQVVPAIQPGAGSVTVFQRTPPWVLPHRNRTITSAERALYRRVPAAQRVVRGLVYWSRELIARPLLTNGRALARLEAMARRHAEQQVADPALRAALIPTYRPGCKRLLPSNDWYRAVTRPNVELVQAAVGAVTPDGVVDATGRHHEVDAIVWATGFQVTDNPVLARVHGRRGRSLAERFAEHGMRAYLGTTVPEFPNLFLLAGPNTGIGHTSLVVMIEAQLRYVVDALRTMETRRATSVEVREPVMAAWDAEMIDKGAGTVWMSGGCASWYLDADGRNTTLWPDQTYRFRRRTRRFDPGAYELRAAAQPATVAAGGRP
jgi:cation diffusion facilitator CzcD-associated flavoprotein CzcO